RRRSQRLRAKRCAGNDKKRCSCECPEGRSFPHEGEVMPGIEPLGKLFFSYFFDRFPGQKPTCSELRAVVSAPRARTPLEDLIVGKIIRPRLRRRNEYLVAPGGNAAMSARNELVFVRVGRDDPGAARRQTINEPSIGR